MKFLKLLLVAVVMLSGVIIPPTGDEDPVPSLFCYGSDCHEFW